MRAFARLRKSRGFTLVELMIVVAIIGILAALAIYGVRRYMASAKTSEAKNTIGGISRSATQAYERESANNQMLPDATSGTVPTNALCTSAPGVPSSFASVKGIKYQPSTADGSDFNVPAAAADTGRDSWKCLKFSLTQPTYYQYGYGAGAAPTGMAYTYTSAGEDPTGFVAVAMGDLNGDGVASTFARGAVVLNGQVKLSTQVYVQNEFE